MFLACNDALYLMKFSFRENGRIGVEDTWVVLFTIRDWGRIQSANKYNFWSAYVISEGLLPSTIIITLIKNIRSIKMTPRHDDNDDDNNDNDNNNHNYDNNDNIRMTSNNNNNSQ